MMPKLLSVFCLFMSLQVSGTCWAKDFMIGAYRAHALIGEAQLSEGTDYVSFTGDFGFADSVPTNAVVERHLIHESKLLSNFQLSVINLEFMLPGFSGRDLDRRIDNIGIRILKRAGYDLITRANNHALDHGVEGLRYNTTQLRQAGLAMIGMRDFPVYEWETGGRRVAIYALANSFDQAGPEELVLSMHDTDLGLVRRQTSQAHFRIAFVHLGSASSFPSPHERQQVHRLLDTGADLVVCTGTHFIKGVVTERGKPVVYGIGNHLMSAKCCNIEPFGMHLVAGFRSGEFVQLFVVPFWNTYREGRTGPLDEDQFAQFKSVLLERSTGDTSAYYTDPRIVAKFKDALGSLSFSSIKEMKLRHLVYATRIAFRHYPIIASVGLAGVVMLPLLLLYWTFRRHRQFAA